MLSGYVLDPVYCAVFYRDKIEPVQSVAVIKTVCDEMACRCLKRTHFFAAHSVSSPAEFVGFPAFHFRKYHESVPVGHNVDLAVSPEPVIDRQYFKSLLLKEIFSDPFSRIAAVFEGCAIQQD